MSRKQTSDKWLEELYPGARVVDPDGWDRANLQYSFYEEKISEIEFNNRFFESTVSMKPYVPERTPMPQQDKQYTRLKALCEAVTCKQCSKAYGNAKLLDEALKEHRKQITKVLRNM